MKLLSAAAILILAALGAVAEAGPLPQPTTIVQRQKENAHFTHHVRGDSRKLPEPKRITVDQPVAFRFSHFVRGN